METKQYEEVTVKPTQIPGNMATILITGGTGLIGKALTTALISRGYRVIILTRNKEKAPVPSAGLSYALWDIDKRVIDINALGQADHIVHLAGAGIADK